MYVDYWNLREHPFQNFADTRFAYLSAQHREGLARLLYLVDGRKLGGVLAGPYGVGKSMVLELLAEDLSQRDGVRYLRVDATPAGSLPLIRTVLQRLGLTQPVEDLAQALECFEALCSDPRANFSHLVLAIDEAQYFKDETALAFMHLLTNLRLRRKEAYGPSAVSLLLAGHEDILGRIRGDVSLAQRLQVQWLLEPLNDQQTVEYVHFRIRRAGGDIWIFEQEALQALHRISGGLPRVINNLCDVALVLGCAARAQKIQPDLIALAAEQNGMQQPAAPEEPS